MIGGLILLLIIFSFLLVKAADLVIVALRRIARWTKTGVFALSAIILAIGTSFPELFVGITSAIEKEPNLSLGVILGSNIANISLVAGLTAFAAGKVHVHGDFLKRDVWIALVAGILPMILILDGELSRVDGLVLLAVYGAYASSFFKARFMEVAKEHKKESFFYRFLRRFNHIDSKRTKEFGRLFVGIALLLFSADVIVKISTQLALIANMPVFVIGLVLVAAGTSLPEFAFSLRTLEDHEPSMFFGNLLGSTIANSTLVIGTVSVIHPIKVLAVDQYFIAVIAFIIIFSSFWYFIRSKHRLDRWEAGILLLLYAVFLIIEFI
ncbi:sodium:calcium antiporter [Candidatus Woesebacteria bacterium]|nr:sodium:calcium antiporter [Candidatus Woesebacteria bacterium]